MDILKSYILMEWTPLTYLKNKQANLFIGLTPEDILQDVRWKKVPVTAVPHV